MNNLCLRPHFRGRRLSCFWGGCLLHAPNRKETSHPILMMHSATLIAEEPSLCNHFHTTKPPPKYKHSLLVLPSVNAILNFATKFFEMLTKKQSEHPQTVFQVFQVFQVFRVFQVFHFAFGPQNSPVLVQIRTKTTNRYPPTSAIKWVRKTPKKAIHPLVDEHGPILQAIGAVFFGEADFLSGRRRANLPSEMAYRGQLHASEAKPKRCLEPAAAKAISLGGSVVARIHRVGSSLGMPTAKKLQKIIED